MSNYNGKIIVGIDPSRGFAVADSQGKLLRLESKPTATDGFLWIWRELEHLRERIGLVVIEAPQKNSPVHPRTDGNGRLIDGARFKKIAQNVGENKAQAKLLAALARDLGLDVLEIRPTKKSGTKMKRSYFESLTGWHGDSTEHSRDAAMLIVGRTINANARENE